MLTDEQVSDALNAAVTEIDNYGLAHARLERIAQMAGVTLVELNRSFPTVEEMFRRVVEQVIGEPMARASRELPSGPAADQLRNYAGRAWEILNTPVFARIYRLVMAEVPRYPVLAKYFAEEVSGPVRRRMESIISCGISGGEFRPVVPSAAARALAGALLTQAFWCNHAEVWGQEAGGTPSRVVPETLGLMLEGLHRRERMPHLTEGRPL